MEDHTLTSLRSVAEPYGGSGINWPTRVLDLKSRPGQWLSVCDLGLRSQIGLDLAPCTYLLHGAPPRPASYFLTSRDMDRSGSDDIGM